MSEHEKLIARINELSKLSRERALTPEEAAERQQLRDQYLQQFRTGFRAQLDTTYVQRDDGSKVPIKDWHEAVKGDAKDAFSGEPSAD